MRVLFDNGTPRGVAAALSEHVVVEARTHGWDTLRNGEILDAAEGAGYEVFVTTRTAIGQRAPRSDWLVGRVEDPFALIVLKNADPV